jgi:glutathione reductase (NADPH)
LKVLKDFEMNEHQVDLFVIGGGSGGVRAARIAANHGAKVMLAEEYRMGGTCVIRGCVPKKLYVYASRFAHAFDEAAGFGWKVPEPHFDFATLKAAKDKEIARLEAVYGQNLAKAGVEIVAQRAVVTGPNSVKLADGREISAKTILIATGGHPVKPDAVPGIHLAENSNDLFEWESLPKSVAIVGAGYIGVEFACLLNGLGSQVTLILRREHVLPRFDHDLRQSLTDAMRKSGITILTETDVERLDGRAGHIALTTLQGQCIEAERVIYATGRRPNTRGLGLENAGVSMDEAGGIIVDDYARSSVPSIYAVGDVTNRVQLTPVAIREGHAFADSVFGGNKRPPGYGVVPTAVFSTPELGTVGLTEEEARKSHQIEIYKTSFRAMKATLSGSDDRVLMKIIVDKTTNRVLGVHLLGEGSGEMIQLLGVALDMGATKADLDRTLAVHPTAAEELVTMRAPVG